MARIGSGAMAADTMRASPRVVAGSAGFLGSDLCERLLRLGHSVLCVDNLTMGARGNLDELTEEPRFRLMLHDIAEPLRTGLGELGAWREGQRIDDRTEAAADELRRRGLAA